MNKIVRALVDIAVAFCIYWLDRSSKLWALAHCQQKIEFNSFAACELAFNRGVSWGLFHSQDLSVFMRVSLLITGITILLTCFSLMRAYAGKPLLGTTLIIAGSFSNIVDRYQYGGVIDFIELSYGNYSWPIFNIADVFIVLGVLILAWEFYRE